MRKSRSYVRDHIEVIIDKDIKDEFIRCAKQLTGRPASHTLRLLIYDWVVRNRKKCVDNSHEKLL